MSPPAAAVAVTLSGAAGRAISVAAGSAGLVASAAAELRAGTTSTERAAEIAVQERYTATTRYAQVPSAGTLSAHSLAG